MIEEIGTHRDKTGLHNTKTKETIWLTAEGAKEVMLNLQEMNNKELLRVTRELAVNLAEERGEVCVDDVREFLDPAVLEAKDKRWFGVVFRDPRFRFLRKEHSKVVKNHANIMNIYGLK